LSDASGVGVTKLMFGDAATYIHQSADSHLDVVADGDITLAATDIKVGLASQDANIQALTDAFDMTLSQYDGTEVARVFDGAKALTDTDAATRKPGFGFRRPVIDIDASGANKAVTLTDKESGALIKVLNSSGSYAATITLPAVGADSEGVFFDFVVEANNGSAFTIACAASDSTIHAFGITVATAGSDVAGGDVLTIAANATKGTRIRMTAAVGSGTTANILWIADYTQPAGTAPAVA
jgi:PPE-repeat protein